MSLSRRTFLRRLAGGLVAAPVAAVLGLELLEQPYSRLKLRKIVGRLEVTEEVMRKANPNLFQTELDRLTKELFEKEIIPAAKRDAAMMTELLEADVDGLYFETGQL